MPEETIISYQRDNPRKRKSTKEEPQDFRIKLCVSSKTLKEENGVNLKDADLEFKEHRAL